MGFFSSVRVFISVLFVFRMCHASEFKLHIQSDGQYSVSVGNKTWLKSGPMFFNRAGQKWSTGQASQKKLILQNVQNRSSSGIFNTWVETQFTYSFGNSSDSVMTSIRIYKNKNNVLFTQTYITAAANTSQGGMASFNETISGFPCFQVADADEQLGFLSFGGYMFGDTDKTTGIFSGQTDNINDGMSGGPLAIFNKKGNAVIISPYDNVMAASLWHQEKPGGHVSWGIMGGVNQIPANFTYRTSLTFDETINEAFFQWGNFLIDRFGIFNMINRAKNQSADVSLNYLGYWTDNGAYYYYKPETNKTFEDTVKDVKTYAQTQNIPYKYVQIDSWWYPKDNVKAVTSWTPLPSVFPHGLKSLSDVTGWNYVAHNRYWSKETPYAKQNNGSYNFVIGHYGSLPNDIDFWRYLFQQGKAWGLKVYEQDWLNIQTRYMAALQTSLTLGRDWLTQMGKAAAEKGLTIQYCMAMPRHALQSLEIPTVTQARVSDDYQYVRPDQWKIGVTSLFAHAMKLYPSKDTFWTTPQQPGNPFNKTEPYPALEAVVASLSKGPVGPSDMIGGTDRDLLMKCCRADGMLLKPTRLAQAIDKQIITDAFNATTGNKVGEIWMSQSFIATNDVDQEYGILFAADVNGRFSVGIADLHFNVLTNGVYYPYNNASQWKYFNASTTFDLTGCTKKDFCLYYFSPFLNSTTVTAILGEFHKWIPMSTQRLTNIKLTGPDVTLSVTGANMEPVSFLYIANDMLHMANCTVAGGKSSTDCPLRNTIASSTTPSPSTAPNNNNSAATFRLLHADLLIKILLIKFVLYALHF